MTQRKSNGAAALNAIARGVAVLITALIATVSPVSADTVAFTAPAGLATNVGANDPVNLGLVFTANSNFSVDSLGIYDQPQLVASEQVGLDDFSTQALLASTTVLLTDPETNGYLFHSITPVALTAGNDYVVVAFVGDNPWAYGAAPIQDSLVTYLEPRYLYGNTLAFPDFYGGNFVGAYYGPNFTIASTVPEPASVSMLSIGLALVGFLHYCKVRVHG